MFTFSRMNCISSLVSNNKVNFLSAIRCLHQQLSSEIVDLIEKYTQISNDHLTPEIKLRLIVRGSEAWSQRVDSLHPLGEPFWAFYWPGGQALARYILDHPTAVKGKKVLDFGCGSGAGAIAALKSGARSAVANDIDSNALISVQMNGRLNDVEIKFNGSNLIGSECDDLDVILVGDMLYDSDLSQSISDWLDSLHRKGKSVFIGDPGRRSQLLRDGKFLQLAKYELDRSTKEENYGFSQAFVFTLR